MVGERNDELLLLMSRNSASRKLLEASLLQKRYELAVLATLRRLRQDAADHNTAQLIENEKLMVSHTLAKDANSPEEVKSLKNAAMQIDECKRAFDVLKNDPEAYKKAEPTYSSKRKDYSGLPLDAAREFFKSHKTRLDNNLRSAGHHTDKLLLRQRKDNLEILERHYIEMQKQALGIA
jgi:hypothetical protein